jgi:hypothetical protein
VRAAGAGGKATSIVAAGTRQRHAKAKASFFAAVPSGLGIEEICALLCVFFFCPRDCRELASALSLRGRTGRRTAPFLSLAPMQQTQSREQEDDEASITQSRSRSAPESLTARAKQRRLWMYSCLLLLRSSSMPSGHLFVWQRTQR